MLADTDHLPGDPEVSVRELPRRRPILVLGFAVVVMLGCLVWVVLVVGRGLPPSTVVMTTGPEGSAYREFGEKYRAALARDGIDLELEAVSGNVENLARLKDGSSGVSVGFVAGGLTSEKASPGIESLGTISYDPIWVFCRGLPDEAQFGDLRGKRLSIDLDAGVMPDLLRATGLEKAVTIVPLSPDAGAEALLRGEIDCACMLTVADDPAVKKLLADDRVKPMTFRRADAFVALYPYLRKITVPRGVGNLARDLPAEDVTLIAPMASLLVPRGPAPRRAVPPPRGSRGHPLGPRHPPKARPSFRLPSRKTSRLSKEARTYYKTGGSFFQRHLPFWLAVIASRVLLLLVPLAGVLYPLMRSVPAAIQFVVERRVNALYAELRAIEARIEAGDPAGEVSAGARAPGREDHADPRAGLRHPRALRTQAGCRPRRRPAARARTAC